MATQSFHCVIFKFSCSILDILDMPHYILDLLVSYSKSSLSYLGNMVIAGAFRSRNFLLQSLDGVTGLGLAGEVKIKSDGYRQFKLGDRQIKLIILIFKNLINFNLLTFIKMKILNPSIK